MSNSLPAIIVPARLASVRFPNKLLQNINGHPLILLTAKRLKEVANEFELFFAVDGIELEKILDDAGFNTIQTSPDLPSGTDRIAEANRKLRKEEVINVQADEPLVDRSHILALVKGLRHPMAKMATLAIPFTSNSDFQDSNQVKVVTNEDGLAMYFSRSQIPANRDSSNFEDYSKAHDFPLKHLGMYGYQGEFLEEFSHAPQGRLEKLEKLEQLRALEMGHSIAVSLVEKETVGIDVPEDLKKLDKFNGK